MQDVLQEQLAQTVFKALKEQGGHIYVCGDVTMAGDVLKTVQRIVRQQGQLSVEEAGAFISKLRVSSVCTTRYHASSCHGRCTWCLLLQNGQHRGDRALGGIAAPTHAACTQARSGA